jgi:hypothetical protein
MKWKKIASNYSLKRGTIKAGYKYSRAYRKMFLTIAAKKRSPKPGYVKSRSTVY